MALLTVQALQIQELFLQQPQEILVQIEGEEEDR
jgi:hypothetical protein